MGCLQIVGIKVGILNIFHGKSKGWDLVTLLVSSRDGRATRVVHLPLHVRIISFFQRAILFLPLSNALLNDYQGTNHIMLHNSHLGTAIHVERKQNFNKYKFGWEKSSSSILFLEFVLGERKLSIAQCISITLWSPTHS